MKKLAVVLVSVLLLLVLATIPVLAIADPDTPPSVNAVYVYDLTDGGVGVLIDYFLDYAVAPTETATEAYLSAFIDTDGITQLKSIAPYAFDDKGYGHGLMWIRFTEDEVTADSIDSASIALYKVWLMGNPTVASGWSGDPPKTEVGIDEWTTVSDPSTLLAMRMLYYADILELEWSLDLIEETSIGSKLTTLGESYFTNVIPNLRDLAPACFSSGTHEPTPQDIDYETEFGAVATSGTATVVGSPVTLIEGTNTIDTGVTTGTIFIELENGTTGTITDLVGTVTGSPADLTPGTNTLTVTGAGTFTVVVNLINTSTGLEDIVIGTGFDLTAVATAFGMTRWMFSGLVWMLVTVIICAALYRNTPQSMGSSGAGKIVMIVFDICIIGGTLLGLLHILVAALMFIGAMTFTAYVVFFRGANV